MDFKLLPNEDAQKAAEILEKAYPNAHYYLNFDTPIHLLAAAILSAQTHDEVVNAATPELFEKYKTAKDFASADANELVKLTSKISFAGNKARNIIAACKTIGEKYGGKVPKTIEELTELPGIGRKTANTILINAYGIVNGIPVDTWVIKLSSRIGLSKNKDPDKIEADLEKALDKKYWHNITYVMKSHGKKICQSQVPICSQCIIGPNSKVKLCPRNGVAKSK